jgi:uncharacterized protein YpmS
MDKFWKLITENKVVAVILAAILLLIAYYFLFLFSKRTQNQLSPKDIPSEGSTEGSAEDIAALANDLAEQLFREMEGINITSRDITPYENLLNTSNVLFEATYRAFGIRDGETLKQWISGETTGAGILIKEEFYYLKEAILNRMQTLNLN